MAPLYIAAASRTPSAEEAMDLQETVGAPVCTQVTPALVEV